MINFLYLALYLVSFLGSLPLFAGPTHRHLEQHSLEEIIETLEPEYEIDRTLLVEMTNTVLKIADNETEDTFFGYHGMSQNSRLFQDILNAVFEEVLQISLPKDFYFLRIPGDAAWNWENGKTTFLDSYYTKPVPQEYKDLILTNFLLIVEKGIGQTLKLPDFSPAEYAVLWNFFQDHLEYLFWSDWVKKAEKYSMPEGSVWEKPIANKNLPAVVEMIVQKALELNPQSDSSTIRKWFSTKFNNFYDTWMVFMLKELKLDDQELLKDIANLDLKFDDTQSPQKALLVSLNASVLGNYTDTGSFSAGIFFENKSVLKGDAHLEQILEEFFSRIGLDPSLIGVLWSEGQKILLEAGNNRGCLLQFFDESVSRGMKPMFSVEQDLYVSFRHGIPVFDLMPSKYIQGHYFLTKEKKDLELRLVMNNKTNLNPFSTIRIVRHDGLCGLDQEKIPFKMKELLKQSSKDEVKIQLYLECLENLWGVTLRDKACHSE